MTFDDLTTNFFWKAGFKRVILPTSIQRDEAHDWGHNASIQFEEWKQKNADWERSNMHVPLNLTNDLITLWLIQV